MADHDEQRDDITDFYNAKLQKISEKTKSFPEYFINYFCLASQSARHLVRKKMSRWVRCSDGKRAGFVGANIDIFPESSKKYSKNQLFIEIFFVSLHRGITILN